MNCQDIALILDDGDVTHLDAGVQREANIHLHSCPDCARDWELHGRLVRKVLPAMPAGMEQRCRELVAEASPRRSLRSRHLMTIAAIALAAAAALWVASRNPPAPAPVASAPAPEPVADHEEPTPGVAEHLAESDGEKTPSASSPASAFSIWLLPIDPGSDDAAIRAVARELHEAVLEGLRGISGASVFDGNLADGRRPDYIVNIAGGNIPSITDPANRWRFQVSVQVPRSTRSQEQLAAYDSVQILRTKSDAVVDGYVQSIGYSSLVSLEAPCAILACASRQAADTVEFLRLNVFLQDIAKQRELYARFLAPGTDFATRQKLLIDFEKLSNTGRPTPIDDRFIRGILDTHADAQDRAQRLALWGALLPFNDSALIEPIIGLIHRETDEQVRAMLVTRLATNFKSDARARSALEEIAAGDASELARQIARRAMAGDDGWHQYVSTTIRDENLSPQQRWAPVDYILHQGSTMSGALGPMNQSLRTLDSEALAALAKLLPHIWAESQSQKDSPETFRFQNLFNRVKDPAFARLLLQSLDGGSPFSKAAIVAMLEKYADDAAVAEALEKLSASDADVKVREAAARVLAHRRVPAETSAQDP